MAQNSPNIIKTVNQISKIVERCKIDTSNTQIQDHALVWFGTDTSIKGDGV